MLYCTTEGTPLLFANRGFLPSPIMSNNVSIGVYSTIPDVDQSDRTVEESFTKEPLRRYVVLSLFFVAATVVYYHYQVPRHPVSRNQGLLLLINEEQPRLSPCVFYLSKSDSPKVIQTSLGEPSAQWSEVACFRGTEETKMIFPNPSARIKVKMFGSSSSSSSSSFPEILGFGGAFTQATSLNYNRLGGEGKAAFLELIFGATGLGYSMGRVPINSCDFSVSSYSFDDIDGDFSLSDFDESVSNDKLTINLIEAASNIYQNAGWSSTASLKIIASPWSPPAWMKKPTSSDPVGSAHATSMTGSSYEGGTCLRDNAGPSSKYAASWALYISKFITAYKNQGVTLFGITVQNEPEFAAPWEACAYDKEVEREFVQNHLEPTIRADHPDLKIFIFDHNKDHAVEWTKAFYSSKTVVDGTAYHWYAGGMDRLLDGGVGQANLHRLRAAALEQEIDDYLLVGSEACHCPSTGYAGGDLKVAWARAERYAHTILADLAAGSNAWIEWNLLLDAKGGPNHLGNVCDAPILAVPHRATGAPSVPLLSVSEKPGGSLNVTSNKEDTVVGETRTKEELNAMGNPAKFIDVGLVVQPMYYYVGHISRHVRPGARAVPALVDDSTTARIFRPLNHGVAGGGYNDLAREGIEATMWPCEGSTRQEWKFDLGKWKVFGHDWVGKPTVSCLGKEIDKDFQGLLLTSCEGTDAGVYEVRAHGKPDKNTGNANIILTNGASVNGDKQSNCLRVSPLMNEGGTYGNRGGAQVSIGDCDDDAALWEFLEESGEIVSNFFDGGEVCLTTGWPFLQVGAFENAVMENAGKVIVVLNEANESANFVLTGDDGDLLMSSSIPAHSIQTILI